MQLEDYLEFISPEEIKLKEHRVWVEDVLYEYIHKDKTLEELVERFDTLTKEEILAVLLYYHRNKAAMDKYLADYLEYCERSYQDYSQKNVEFVERMRRRKEEWLAKKELTAS